MTKSIFMVFFYKIMIVNISHPKNERRPYHQLNNQFSLEWPLSYTFKPNHISKRIAVTELTCPCIFAGTMRWNIAIFLLFVSLYTTRCGCDG